MWSRYKSHVAPIYRNEIDRHLFATASGGGNARRLKQEKTRREWLAARWKSRWARWTTDSAQADA